MPVVEPVKVEEQPPRPVILDRSSGKLDTNKLPKIDDVLRRDLIIDDATDGEIESPAVIDRIVINADLGDDALENTHFEDEDMEDLAPISMRVNATVFDAIIAVAATIVVMMPALLSGVSWLSVSGALLFVGLWSLISFAYMTVAVGFYGKTLGMRLFGLELIDAEENEFPTLQQAAINSSVYLMSVFTMGIGFLAVFFNDERRAAHDLVSGTIVVREF